MDDICKYKKYSELFTDKTQTNYSPSNKLKIAILAHSPLAACSK